MGAGQYEPPLRFEFLIIREGGESRTRLDGNVDGDHRQEENKGGKPATRSRKLAQPAKIQKNIGGNVPELFQLMPTRPAAVGRARPDIPIDRCVAFASRFPQSFQIEDLDLPARIFYDAGPLDGMRRRGDARPPDPQHFCEKLLGEQKRVAAG